MDSCDEGKVIEIAMASDQGYVAGLMATAASIAMSADKNVWLSYNILDGGIDDVSFDFLKTRLESMRPHLHIKRFKINEERFSNYPSQRGNRMTYTRFFLIDLLKDVDHVIYTDVDVIWQKDISGLWAKRLDSVILQACRDPDVLTSAEPDWFRLNGFSFVREHYFNAGILLMNLRLFRERDIVRKSFEFLDAHRDVVFHDQTTWNVLLGSETTILSETWMRFSRFVSRDELNNHPIVIHYVNQAPWKVSKWWTDDLAAVMFDWFGVYAKVLGIPRWRAIFRLRSPWRALKVCASSMLMGNAVSRFVICQILLWLGYRNVAKIAKSRW